jgi:hypothetical protein
VGDKAKGEGRHLNNRNPEPFKFQKPKSKSQIPNSSNPKLFKLFKRETFQTLQTLNSTDPIPETRNNKQ